MFKKCRSIYVVMSYQTKSLGLKLITQRDIAEMIGDSARSIHTPLQSGEFYNTRHNGSLNTPEKLKLHLARMGAGGDGAYAALILLATKSPDGLATYLPDDNYSRGLQQSLPIPDFSRDQSRLGRDNSQTNPNTGKQERKYHGNMYAYSKYARIGHLKSAAKAAYGKVESEIAKAIGKIKEVYQSSKGFLRTKAYKGQDVSSNVVSLGDYRAVRENMKYVAQKAPSATLEEKVA